MRVYGYGGRLWRDSAAAANEDLLLVQDATGGNSNSPLMDQQRGTTGTRARIATRGGNLGNLAGKFWKNLARAYDPRGGCVWLNSGASRARDM